MNLKEIKKLVRWAKKERLRSIRIGDVEIKFSNKTVYAPDSNQLARKPDSSGNIERNLQIATHSAPSASGNIDEDPDLFYSVE